MNLLIPFILFILFIFIRIFFSSSPFKFSGKLEIFFAPVKNTSELFRGCESPFFLLFVWLLRG